MTVAELLLVEVQVVLHLVLRAETGPEADEAVAELGVVDPGGSDGNVRLGVGLDGQAATKHGRRRAETVLHHGHHQPGPEVRNGEVGVHVEVVVLSGDGEALPGAPHPRSGGEAGAADGEVWPGVEHLGTAVLA